MSLFDAIRNRLSALNRLVSTEEPSLYECRRCGESFDTEPDECSRCGSESIASYHLSTFQ